MSIYKSFTIVNRDGVKLKVRAQVFKNIDILMPTDINGNDLAGSSLLADISSQLLPYNDPEISIETSGAELESLLENQLEIENSVMGLYDFPVNYTP